MSYLYQEDKPLTPEEQLLADVVASSQKIPCGFQIGMPMHLERAIALVEDLFTKHNLPLKDELLGELRLWKDHAEQGRKFSDQADLLMQKFICLVDGMKKQAPVR